MELIETCFLTDVNAVMLGSAPNDSGSACAKYVRQCSSKR